MESNNVRSKGNFNSFLADGDQHGGSINEGILTKVKFPVGRFKLIGDNVITNQILTKVSICQPPGEHFDSVNRYLRKALKFAEELPSGEKKDRYLAMIRHSIYEEYSEKIGNGVKEIHIKNPMIRKFLKEAGII